MPDCNFCKQNENTPQRQHSTKTQILFGQTSASTDGPEFERARFSNHTIQTLPHLVANLDAAYGRVRRVCEGDVDRHHFRGEDGDVAGESVGGAKSAARHAVEQLALRRRREHRTHDLKQQVGGARHRQ